MDMNNQLFKDLLIERISLYENRKEHFLKSIELSNEDNLKTELRYAVDEIDLVLKALNQKLDDFNF